MQIRISKSDGSLEPYLHTKVLGSFHHALPLSGGDHLYAAEQMAEAVTYYLYRQVRHGTLSADDIHQMILEVLSSTGHHQAAEKLCEHRLKRKLQRKRVEVIDDVQRRSPMSGYGHWDKTRIIDDLINQHSIDRFLARAIASAVEEKILKMELSKVRTSLIHQLVVADTESMLDAHRQLAAV